VNRLEKTVRNGYYRMIGPRLSNVAIDGCITKSPCGGELAAGVVRGWDPDGRRGVDLKRGSTPLVKRTTALAQLQVSATPTSRPSTAVTAVTNDGPCSWCPAPAGSTFPTLRWPGGCAAPDARADRVRRTEIE